jgi:3-oxoacyl-[acyl-carrier protein] reductase
MAQRILITGASRGLGFSIAESCAHDGCRLILISRSAERLDAVVAELPNSEEHFPLALDLLKSDSGDELLKTLVLNDIVPDVIIHNLGGAVDGDCHPLRSEVLRKSMALNVEAAVNINNALIPLMAQRGSGKIIHISSDAAINATAAPAYSIAKTALNAYIVNTARNYIKNNIVIYGVMPGIFEYPGSAWSNKKTSDPDSYRSKIQSMPIGRFMTVKEVSEVVSKLSSIDSIAMSGSLIKLNGSAP